ncbi:MAG: hypothetical protein ABSE86_24195 [Bryobacteraceae bacterium]|jgi:chromosome segregation ATPase
MPQKLFCLLILPLLAGSAFAQTPSSDSETLRLLLEEVRQLRQELKTTTAAVERAHILIYRVQFQEAAVARNVQRLDDARSKLAQTQSRRADLSVQVKRAEDKRAGASNAVEQKQSDDELTRIKAYIDTVVLPDEQQRQTAVTDCEQQLRLEQDKLTELQNQLDQLDTALKNTSPTPVK